jgi:UDP-4-amino-4,6-dideoxy-N-acetyl-beta-L-altrosamine transaminase
VSAATEPFLPYGRHLVEEDDIAAVTAVLRGNHLTSGPAVDAFENALATRVGARHAASCTSATAGLHLAAMALGLRPGDRVIVPALTFLATANAARYVGGEVVFADVDQSTGLMGAAELEAALARAGDPRPVAVFPVHLNGQCADMSVLGRVARAHGLKVVEDACHALGGSHRHGDRDSTVGDCAYSDLAVFSFHPVKTVAMGEGGAVTTNDSELHERVRRLRNHGMVKDPSAFEQPARAFAADGAANPWYYEVTELGFNYRASDIHCALGLSQLAKLDRFVARRRQLADGYDQRLERLAPVVRPLSRVRGCHPAWHLYVVQVDFPSLGLDRATLMSRLRAKGIGTQVHYLPLHLQPYYQRRYGAQSLPGSEAYYARALSLPLFPGLGDDEVDRVVAALRAALD